MESREKDLRHRDLTGRIIKAFYEVYNEMGHGYVESVYQHALALALKDEGLVAESQCALTVWFHGYPVGDFRADFVVEGTILIELKCSKAIDPVHEAQLLNYLRATDLEVGLLLNFGPKPEFKRLVFENTRKRIPHPHYSA